jgi:hypothetical protein
VTVRIVRQGDNQKKKWNGSFLADILSFGFEFWGSSGQEREKGESWSEGKNTRDYIGDYIGSRLESCCWEAYAYSVANNEC